MFRIVATIIVVNLICIPTGFAGCPIRIMPLGDSITSGTGTTPRVGYRKVLWKRLVDEGYDVDFVGSLKNYRGDFDVHHEGHGGRDAKYIAKHVLKWVKRKKPDIVLLHIGTNSFSDGVKGVEEILDKIDQYEKFSQTPVTVILAQIVNSAKPSNKISFFNKQLATLVHNRIKYGDKITLVNMESALKYPGDMHDEYHPNRSGYMKMAEVWFDGLRQHLSACRLQRQ